MLGAHDQEPRKDELTGLPGRAELSRELAFLSGREPGNFALAFIDIDDLKYTNDTIGHSAGDELIRTAAETLEETFRRGMNADRRQEEDYLGRDVFRLAGDEFVAILKGTDTQEKVDAALGRVQENLLVKGIRASMGGRPHRRGEEPEELLRDVDAKMYEQKRARKRERRRQEVSSLPARKRLAFYLGSTLVKYSGAERKGR